MSGVGRVVQVRMYFYLSSLLYPCQSIVMNNKRMLWFGFLFFLFFVQMLLRLCLFLVDDAATCPVRRLPTIITGSGRDSVFGIRALGFQILQNRVSSLGCCHERFSERLCVTRNFSLNLIRRATVHRIFQLEVWINYLGIHIP